MTAKEIGAVPGESNPEQQGLRLPGNKSCSRWLSNEGLLYK